MTEKQAEKAEAHVASKRKEPTHSYEVGAVGDKGQSINGKFYKAGDKVELTLEEFRRHRSNGVPLIDASEHQDKDEPRDPGDVKIGAA